MTVIAGLRTCIDRLEFVVNFRTAKTLGLTIPQSALARVDDVIQ